MVNVFGESCNSLIIVQFWTFCNFQNRTWKEGHSGLNEKDRWLTSLLFSLQTLQFWTRPLWTCAPGTFRWWHWGVRLCVRIRLAWQTSAGFVTAASSERRCRCPRLSSRSRRSWSSNWSRLTTARTSVESAAMWERPLACLTSRVGQPDGHFQFAAASHRRNLFLNSLSSPTAQPYNAEFYYDTPNPVRIQKGNNYSYYLQWTQKNPEATDRVIGYWLNVRKVNLLNPRACQRSSSGQILCRSSWQDELVDEASKQASITAAGWRQESRYCLDPQAHSSYWQVHARKSVCTEACMLSKHGAL